MYFFFRFTVVYFIKFYLSADMQQVLWGQNQRWRTGGRNALRKNFQINRSSWLLGRAVQGT